MSNLRDSIRRSLATGEEITKRQITISLEGKILDKIDRIGKEFSKISESKNYSRNTIVEMALVEFIKESASVLNEDHGIDIEEEITEELNDLDREEEGVAEFNLAVYPARNEGFNKVFLGEDQWYSVRIKSDKIDRIQYVACYRAAPISGITHYAKVSKIAQHDDGKYKIIFDGKAILLPQTIKLGNTNANAMRPPRYSTLERLLVAKEVCDLF